MKLNQIICGDCLEVMKDIPGNSIDMVLCDLPYGTTQNKWDSIINLDLLWIHYEYICKESAAIVLFAQTPFDKILGCSNLKDLKYEWIWGKESGTGFLNAKKMPLKNHENILVFYKNLPKYNPQMRSGYKKYSIKKSGGSENYKPDSKKDIITVNNGDRYPLSILKFKRDFNKKHPTQKPISLFEYLIKTYTNKGDLVLDNCVGSGTTALAASQTGRNFIGIEQDPKYCRIANQRINQAQLSLF